MPRSPLASLAALILMLGGCQTVFDLAGVEQPLSASESRKFDGSYQGDIAQQPQGGHRCPVTTGERVLMVGDGVLWFAYDPMTFFTAPVMFDGSIVAQSGAAHLAGQITGNHLDMTVRTPDCHTTVVMRYVYNHS